MRPFLTIEVESRWRANVRGQGSWQLCRDAGRRRPSWSPVTRSWVVSEATARRVVELAEEHGMGVVIAGPRTAEVRELSNAADSSETEEAGLW